MPVLTPAIVSSSGLRTLTRCELEVLQAAANGRTRKQTAAELHKSLNTIKTHRQRLRQVLGAENMQHAVWLAFQRGILTVCCACVSALPPAFPG